jgi:hypothetical protein
MEKAMNSAKAIRINRGVLQIRLTKKDTERLEPVMRNWLRVHDHIVKQPFTWKGYDEVNRMLRYELGHKKRRQVISRLLGRMLRVMQEINKKTLS